MTPNCGQLECGCWYACSCAQKAEAEKARVLLKMVDLDSVIYSDTNGSYSLYLQPFEKWSRKYGGIWIGTALSIRRYTSLDGLKKGVSKIIQQKTGDPNFLILPPPDARIDTKRQSGTRFHMLSKRKKDTAWDMCRMKG